MLLLDTHNCLALAPYSILFLGTRWSWLKLLQKFFFEISIDFTSMLLLDTHNCLALAPYSILFLGTRWSCLKLLQKFFFEISIDLTSDRKSTRLNSSHVRISYAVFCLKKKKKHK